MKTLTPLTLPSLGISVGATAPAAPVGTLAWSTVATAPLYFDGTTWDALSGSTGVVTTTGAQTISDVKTFSSPPVMSGASIAAGTIPNAALATTPVAAVTASGNLASSGGTTPAITMTATPSFTSVTTTGTETVGALSSSGLIAGTKIDTSGNTGAGLSTGDVRTGRSASTGALFFGTGVGAYLDYGLSVAGAFSFTAGLYVTGLNSSGGGAFGGILSTSSGALQLTNATSNMVQFPQAGVAAPAYSTRSAGTRLLLYPSLSSSATDIALGVSNATLWSSVATSGYQFQWYAGTTVVATLTGLGAFTITGALSAVGGSFSGTLSVQGMQFLVGGFSAIVPATTSGFVITNSANNANNLFLTDAGALTLAGGITATTGTFSGAGTFSGTLTGTTGIFSGNVSCADGTFNRGGTSPGNGAIFFGNAGSHYIYFNGASFQITDPITAGGYSGGAISGTSVYSSGAISCSGAITAQSTLTVTGATVANGGITGNGFGNAVVTLNGLSSTGGIPINGTAAAGSAGVSLGNLNAAGYICAFFSGSLKSYVSSSGTFTASDRRIKTGIVPLVYGLDIIEKLDPVEFAYIDGAKPGFGFIAQDVQTLIPHAVEEAEDSLYLNYGVFTPILIKAMQELSAKFDAYVAAHP